LTVWSSRRAVLPGQEQEPRRREPVRVQAPELPQVLPQVLPRQVPPQREPKIPTTSHHCLLREQQLREQASP
jgi:hypothetical protein